MDANEQKPLADEGRRSSEGLGLEPERAVFEAWRCSDAPGLDMSRNMPDGSYNNPRTHDQWHAWQAAVAAERERCARLCEEYFEKDMATVIRRGY